MKSKVCLFVVAGVFTAALLTGKEVSQADWHEGPGEPGPVTDWGAGFYESADVNYYYMWGRLSLAIAAGEPERHHISDSYSRLDKKIEVAELGGPTDPDSSDIPCPRLDVIVASLDGLLWYPNKGDGTFQHGRPICSSGSLFIGYDLADFNFDGSWDAVVSDFGSSKILLFLNDGEGNFTEHCQVAIQKGVHQCAAADFDNDGDIDVVATNHHNARGPSLWDCEHWYENDGSNLVFIPHPIDTVGRAARRINTGDIDSDGDVDFITSAHHGTYWLENVINSKGADSAFVIHVIQDTTKNIYDWIGDVNRDGHVDILAANLDETHTYSQWWENDGNECFVEHLVGEGTNPEGIVPIDIDYDGDIDIIQSYWGRGTGDPQTNGIYAYLGWFENDGHNNFTYQKFSDYKYSCDLQVADISGNGLLDLVTSTHGPGYSTDWWELFDHFSAEGELTSSIYDAGGPAIWESIDWQADTTRNTDIRFKVRASNDPAQWPEWRSCKLISAPGLIEDIVDQNTRYIQYKVIMTTKAPNYSPLLYKVSIAYDDAGGIMEDLIEIPTLLIEDCQLSYNLDSGDQAQLAIFDVTGRQLLQLRVFDRGEISLNEFTPGVYFVKLESETSLVTEKFILTR